MLSAFTARPLVELKPRDKSKISSVLVNGDRLLVGLNYGSLRIYRINEIPPDEPDQAVDHEGNGNGDGRENDNGNGLIAATPSTATTTTNRIKDKNKTTTTDSLPEAQTPKPKQTELLREVEKFSRYKIEQLAQIKEANVLVSLSGGYIFFHDLQTYSEQEQLSKTKGATTFAVTSNIVNDPETGVPSIVSRLAVAVKRKILLWTWRDMELESDTSELTLVSGVKMLTWASGTKLVAGLGSSFAMVDIESGTVVDLAGPGSIGGPGGQETGRFSGVGVASMSYMMGGIAPKPLATRLDEGHVLLAKDINTHFIDLEGNSLGRRQVPWSQAPAQIGYSYPFLLALHDPSKGVLEVRNPETLSLLQSISLPHADIMHIPQPTISLAHAGKGFLVASDRVIWRMESLDYDSQIDALVEKGYLDEAISLVSMLEDALLKDKPGRLRAIKLEKAQSLFNVQKYRDAMDLFTEISAPPEMIIRLYPTIIAGDLSSVEENQEGSDSSTVDNQQKPGDLQTQVDVIPSSSEDTANNTKPPVHAPSVRSLLRTKIDEGSDSGSIRGSIVEDTQSEKRLQGKDLKNAVRELQGYLADVRRRFQRFLMADGALKVEHPLTNGIVDEFTDSVTKLLGLSKDESDNEFAERIREKARVVDTTLFRAHMFATPALAGSLFRIANFCDPDVVMERLEETGRYNDLIDFLYGKRMHRHALELLQKFGQAEPEADREREELQPSLTQLQGPKRTVGYLQNLSPEKIDLILQFAEWPLRTDPDLGMEVFLADTENAETLPRERVLSFLEGIDFILAVRYLKHVIGELNDMTPALHQRLLILYLERLQKDKSKQWVFDSESERIEWWDAFLGMLKSSSQYSPAKMLDRVDRDDPDYFEARAIMFSKMGQHKQALEIYVFKLEDYAKAEEYCNHVHITKDTFSTEIVPPSQRESSTASEDDQPSIYLTLLSLYLTPPHGYKPRYGPALDLLARHGSRLPANSALNLVPESLPVKDLQFYFTSRIRAASSILSETRIAANLHKVRNIKTQAHLLVGEGSDGRSQRSRHVTITEERICGVCHKRLGGSVINVFPDNTVVHFGCANRVTGAS